jgi:hypothetical protein
MERSLFRRIARYGVSASANPRENRLTEVLAAVLANEHADGLAEHIALGWLADAQDGFPVDTGQALSAAAKDHVRALHAQLADGRAQWRVDVATQFSFDAEAAGRRRPDLVMSFSRDGHGTIHLWVEVKHGTGPHDHQLQAYANELRRRGMRDATVVLVAPRSGYVGFTFDEMPDDVPRLTWEDTGRLVESFESPGPVGDFLKTELVAYLTEEGLMDPKNLTADHLAALANYHTGRQALDRVCELASQKVGHLWDFAGHPGHYPSGHPAEYWWNYRPVARDGTTIMAPQGATPTWQLLTDGAYLFADADVGVPLLTVGLSGPHGWIAKLDADRCADAEAADFGVYRARETKSGHNEYVVVKKDLDEIFTGGALSDQAELLARWIDTQFRALAVALGP